MQIHHIGYLVKKIDKAVTKFSELGYERKSETIYDDLRKINIVFMEKDNYLIELVSPINTESVVGNLIKKCGNSPYHICYETDCFDEDMEKLTHNGYVCFEEPCSAIAFDGRRVVFLISPVLGIIELVEKI